MGRSRAHPISAAPFKASMSDYRSNSSLRQANGCLLQEAYCSLRGPGHSLDGLKDDCSLWDSTCSGNRSIAAIQFYESVENALIKNKCFHNSPPDCSKNNPVGRLSAFEKVKSWMRSSEYNLDDPRIIEMENGEDVDVIKEDLFLNQTCCGNCMVDVDRVDVYYWPDAHANTPRSWRHDCRRWHCLLGLLH